MAQEGIQSLEQSMEMNPLVLDAFIRVLNDRSEKQEKDSKAESNEKNPSSHSNNPQQTKSDNPPELREQDKAKLDDKLNEFSNWMNETGFYDKYEKMKYAGYVEGKWDEGI